MAGLRLSARSGSPAPLGIGPLRDVLPATAAEGGGGGKRLLPLGSVRRPSADQLAVLQAEALAAQPSLQKVPHAQGAIHQRLYLRELVSGQDPPTLRRRGVLRKPVQKRPYLRDGEPSPLGDPNDGQPLVDLAQRPAVVAPHAVDPHWRRQQTHPFVVAQRRRPDAGPARHLADGHPVHTTSLDLKRTLTSIVGVVGEAP